MKRGGFALLTVMLLSLSAGMHAVAQTTPSVECFSPGWIRFSDAIAKSPSIHVDAAFTAEDALYARDLSVLSEMLRGTVITYDSSGDMKTGVDSLRISRNWEPLFDVSLSRDEAVLCLGDEVYATTAEDLWTALGGDGADHPVWTALGEVLDHASIFERVPLEEVADGLLALQAGEALAGGFHVERAFNMQHTMSDDGTRLTRLDIDGAFSRDDEAPYEISGWLKQPAGRAPKDTFEISAIQDDQNQFTLYYSSTRESKIIQRDKQGEMHVQTTLRSEGKLDGYRIDSRLTVRLTNKWKANEEGLDERIILTATLGHTDRTPNRQMQRLNDISASLNATLELHTSEESILPMAIDNEAKLSITMDSFDFLNGSMSANIIVGSDTVAFPEIAGQIKTEQSIPQAVSDAVQQLAARLYAQLEESSREKIEKDLLIR